MLNKLVGDVIIKAVKDPRVHSETVDPILNGLEPQFASLATRFLSLILAWSKNEVSEMCQYANANMQKRQGRTE